MRFALLALVGALALTACDSGDVPSPAERQQGATVEAPVDANSVELRAEGVAAGPEAFYFAAGQKEVEAALAKALGAALRSSENTECGAGPVTLTDFPGGLIAHFQEGRLVGWNWQAATAAEAGPKGKIRLGGKVQLGSSRGVLEAAPGFAKVEGSTLGEEFALGGKIGGFIAGDKVDMLYAGTQCFVR
ncbi:MAG: aspartate-semialdehyde dehydrogenase [Erythrobacter sp.]